jgi:hypothetical protein
MITAKAGRRRSVPIAGVPGSVTRAERDEGQMFVAIAGGMSAARVTVENADDCTRLHVTADGLDDAAAGDIVRQHRLGRLGTSRRTVAR